MKTEEYLKIEPYSLCHKEKNNALTEELRKLTAHHRARCSLYANYLDCIGYQEDDVKSIEDIPFLPVRLFKDMELKSCKEKDVLKVMASSGTTGQKVSKIYIDRETAMLQQKVSSRQLIDFWGKKRLPFLIIDTPEICKGRKTYAARAAGVKGLQFFSTSMTFALKNDMSLDMENVSRFLKENEDKKFVAFGFTFMVWKHFYEELRKKEIKLDMGNGLLMTGGGWKKFQEEGVSREVFKSEIQNVCGIQRFMDHYGMAEQVGSIYLECEYGHYHASIYSDVVIRDYRDFSPCPIKKRGLIQVTSMVPHSYPGHSILTEDEGVILGEDDCPCGRKGKYIKIYGRVKNAEIRGCSDTYAARF